MSVPLQDPQQSLAGTLSKTAQSIQSEHISLRELMTMIGEQGLLVFCMFLTLPFLLPISIPGVSTIFGLIILLIGIGVALNRLPWLPVRLMNRTIAAEHLLPALEKGARMFARLDRVVRPRLLGLTHSGTINRLNGFALILASLLLMAPLGLIPFSNTFPALAILFLAAGMLQRDGLCVIAGYAFGVLTMIYFGLLVGAALLAGHGLHSMLA